MPEISRFLGIVIGMFYVSIPVHNVSPPYALAFSEL